MARRRNKGDERRIVRRRIDDLLAAAHTESGGPDADLSDRYATLARRVAMRYQVRDPRLRREVCQCGGYTGGSAARVRVRHGRIIRTCLRCGNIRRHGISQRGSHDNE